MTCAILWKERKFQPPLGYLAAQWHGIFEKITVVTVISDNPVASFEAL